MDRRRLLGPLNTIIPNIGISSNPNDIKPDTTIDNDEVSANQIQNFFLKTGIIENANGSAYLEVGNSIIEVSVFGPRPIRGSFVDRASFSVECKFLPYITQPGEQIYNTTNQFNNGNSNTNANGRTGLTTIEQRISAYVETALLPSIILEKYPKSTFDIFITIISTEEGVNNNDEDDDNSAPNEQLLRLTNWIVNCSSVALVDASVELKDIVTSGIVKTTSDGKVIFDPRSQGNEEEEQEEGSVIGVASFMNLRNDELVGIWIERQGAINVGDTEMNNILDGCNEMSKKIRANINTYLANSLE
ncbi:exosome exoribonuclease [Scheffersomyces coipomensis]|uniref:exosome exoribonuclease n=1 Tax=Scheffersomyces coipomensis TaxID=1788519 RepID=UPI00315DBC13